MELCTWGELYKRIKEGEYTENFVGTPDMPSHLALIPGNGIVCWGQRIDD